MNRGAVLVALGIGALALGLWPKKKKPHRITGPRRVAALGDSMTVGGAYLRRVVKGLAPGSAARAFGFGGQGAEFIDREGVPKVIAWNPTDVIVLAGVNDMASGRTARATFGHLAQIYRRLSDRGIRVIALNVLPWQRYRKATLMNQRETKRLNRLILAQPGPSKVAVFRMLPEHYKDGLHLSPAGNKYLGDEIRRQAF